ncbi:MAG: hypothetical protein JO297_14160 [Nitrososphaeraceae archaeon]|nr:hypothetical protein [Nitrososphaeraceae archaeon]
MSSEDIASMCGEYKRNMDELDPESSAEMENLIASDALSECTLATMASWTKSAVGYAVQMSRLDIAQRLKTLHEDCK